MQKKNHGEISDKAFVPVENFEYLAVLLTNQNSIHEEMKIRLNLGNVGYHTFFPSAV
jgi:hypothetical protein